MEREERAGEPGTRRKVEAGKLRRRQREQSGEKNAPHGLVHVRTRDCDAPERRTGHGERRDTEEGHGKLALEAARRNRDGPTARELDFALELARAELSLLQHALHVVKVAGHQRVALRRRMSARRRV